MDPKEVLKSPIIIEICEHCETIWPFDSLICAYKQATEDPVRLCPDCISGLRNNERKLAAKKLAEKNDHVT